MIHAANVVIIGAGISGLLMGIRLRERGFNDFVILEKADTLGSTWRDNVYPGVVCDVALALLGIHRRFLGPDYHSHWATERWGADQSDHDGACSRPGICG